MSNQEDASLVSPKGLSEQGQQALRRFKTIYILFRITVCILIWGSLAGGVLVFRANIQLLLSLIFILVCFAIMRLKSAIVFEQPHEKLSLFLLRMIFFISFCFGFYQSDMPSSLISTSGAWSFGCGLFLLLSGFLLWWRARSQLEPHYYDVVYIHNEQRVYCQGLYAHLRHPGYGAEWLAWVGGLLMLNRFWPALIGSLMLLMAIGYRIWVEEKVLLKHLDGYKDYCRRVSRFKIF